ncbi:MAG TPA: MerR family transcriptional regulator [Gaiella sp.]|jgi:DNA-binding transcriptional MerR regulator|nr:MerR family transcriptional regulator [Gaiella sp.]
MSTATEPTKQVRLHTIGAVCERLRAEFPDISISKIRYLEDQGLLRPRRTRGGYRLFSEGDVERLERILRLQRDEFLPLRVIRDALDTRGTSSAKRRPPALRDRGGELDQPAFCERAGITAEFARRLEEYDLVSPRIEAGDRIYRESDVEIAAACGRLARHGLDARHLRAFRTAAGRQSALLEQLVATGLRSRDLARRRAALDDLEALAGVATELAQQLLVRDLREASER